MGLGMMAVSAAKTIHVLQGEHGISDQPDLVLTTVLGSCVAACLHDPVRRIGGMNHFLLPDAPDTKDIRYATAAMEQLVNSLLKLGGQRNRLVAKLFGGAQMIEGLPDIGRRNGEAALAFLKGEEIAVSAQSLGGKQARRVRFWPACGRAQQLLLPDSHAAQITAAPIPPFTGTIELF
jgi:chemotaxis protein CheD